MMTGYFLRGVQEDHILVFRSEDPEEILRVIMRLKASRDKEIRALANKLELEWTASMYAANKKERKNK